MPRVMITPQLFRDPNGPYAQVLQAAGLEVCFPPHERYFGNAAAMVEMLGGIDAVLASTEPYTPEIIANSQLRVIARCGVGFDSVDVPAATAHHVLVTITPGAVEVSVAEHTLALIFAVFRDVIGRDREVRAGRWSRRAFPRLAGKTLGIVGLGRIGRAVAELAQGVGLTVIAHDPVPNASYCQERGIRCCGLDELLAASDIVSLHLPSMTATRNIIGERALRRMKRDAVLINTGRGGLVDEEALHRVMLAGHLRAAALDVFAEEPLPVTSALVSLPNVILSTHTAGLDEQSTIDMPRIAAENVAKLYRGAWPEGSVVNHELRATWKW